MNCEQVVLAVNRNTDVTPVYGRSREAVIGPAFTPGCVKANSLSSLHPKVSAAFTRLPLRAGRSPVNRADNPVDKVKCVGHPRCTRRKRLVLTHIYVAKSG